VIAKLVGEETLTPDLLPRHVYVPLPRVFGHCARDRVVEATIQGVEILVPDGDAQVRRELCDGLAEVAVVVHGLSDGEPLLEQVAAVLGGGQSHLHSIRSALNSFLSKDCGQLGQK
jgi:hypothetical protein